VLVEIGAGVALGPSWLGWVQADAAVQVLALIGVGFLLLLAGLEIDFDQLRGRVLRLRSPGSRPRSGSRSSSRSVCMRPAPPARRF
jgi:hypothetical protein